MRDDPILVSIIRILMTLLGVVGLAIGVYFFESGPGHALSQAWGWLLDSVLGGGVLGLGIGMGVYGVNGEGEWLERIRVRKRQEKALSEGKTETLQSTGELRPPEER
jgi:hypothetical protein